MTTIRAVRDTERHAAELQARRLRDRIHACVPVTGQAFAKLLSLLSIEVSDEIPTACVTTGARSSMLVNPGFVARHCRTDEHLSMLVLHELYHVLLGHTQRYPCATPAQELDARLSALSCAEPTAKPVRRGPARHIWNPRPEDLRTERAMCSEFEPGEHEHLHSSASRSASATRTGQGCGKPVGSKRSCHWTQWRHNVRIFSHGVYAYSSHGGGAH